ncbi:MAG: helix-turn-helix transcriptional regulator [Clostridia bacterium]
MSTFEDQLISARKERGITQEQLAEEMNVSRQTISHWENGRMKPDEETMKRLSELLKLEECTEAAPMALDEKHTAKSSKLLIRVLAAFVCGIAATLLVVYGLLPLTAKKAEPIPVQATQEQQELLPADYPFEWYQQPAVNEAGKAYLEFAPAVSPVKLMQMGDEGVYTWDIVYFINEINDIPFTITKYTETFFNSEQGVLSVYVKTGAECTRVWQTAMIQSGLNYGYNVYRKVDGSIGYGAAIEGIDANGNELAFGLYIPLSHEKERVFTPADFQQEQPREAGKAYVEIVPENDPFPCIHKAEFSDSVGWEFLFSISNTSDVPFTVKQITQVLFDGEKTLLQKVFTSDLAGYDKLSKGDEPLLHDGIVSEMVLTGIGMLVEGTDANGNELSFAKYVEFAQE